jgi:hypothetical protein
MNFGLKLKENTAKYRSCRDNCKRYDVGRQATIDAMLEGFGRLFWYVFVEATHVKGRAIKQMIAEDVLRRASSRVVIVK